MFEVFKDIKDYEGLYQVSNLGRVKSLQMGKERILKPSFDRYGYFHVTLCKNKKRKGFTVHRLVAQTFIQNPLNLPQINHIDGNKTNNNITNLEWCDLSYNIKHAYKNNLWKPIKFQKTAKPVNVYDLNHNLLAKHLTTKDAAKFIGCSVSSITRAVVQYDGYLKRLKYFIEPCNDYPIASH